MDPFEIESERRGERVVRTLIIKELVKRKEVVAFELKTAKSIEGQALDTFDYIANYNQICAVHVTNGSTLHFKSEPDIEILNKSGDPLGAVEIKAGLDPAGALERLGAMFKSFDSILKKEPNAFTILVESCITDEMRNRIETSSSVRKIFLLTDVMNNRGSKGDILCSSIRSVLGLVSGGM